MRSAPLDFAKQTRELITTLGYPDVLFCTDMLDLPVYLGLLGDSQFHRIPKVVYFHENQWTYPISPNKRVDNHFGYTNLLSAIAADEVWFNSQFHLHDFIRGSRRFLKQMPDTRELHALDALETKARIIPPGFSPISDPQEQTPQGRRPNQIEDQSNKQTADHTFKKGPNPITIGWVSRWEYDKCPDEFVTLLRMLTATEISFQLILLGARPRHPVSELKEIKDTYASQIIHDGFAEDLTDYGRLLGKMDVVVSTANHEFFGIAICEAIWAGAIPIVPDKLSYQEHIPATCRYQTLNDAVDLIKHYTSPTERNEQRRLCKSHIEGMQTSHIIKQIDEHLSALATQTGT